MFAEQRFFEKDKPGRWHAETLALLKRRPARLTFAQIAEETGIDAAWIRAFNAERISDPSVNRIEVLYHYLKSKCK